MSTTKDDRIEAVQTGWPLTYLIARWRSACRRPTGGPRKFGRHAEVSR